MTAPIGNLLRLGDTLRLALELVGIATDVAEQAGGNKRVIAALRRYADTLAVSP